MTWNIDSTADAFLISRLADHNAFTQLLVCTYYFTFYFFPPPNTHFHMSTTSTHLSFGGAMGRFMVAFKVLNTLVVSFRIVFISTHLLQPIRQLNWTSSLSHPPFLTVTPLALCSKHMLTITLPCDEEVVPMSQRMRRFRSLLSCLQSHNQWC